MYSYKIYLQVTVIMIISPRLIVLPCSPVFRERSEINYLIETIVSVNIVKYFLEASP